jgi:hypothetical protein
MPEPAVSLESDAMVTKLAQNVFGEICRKSAVRHVARECLHVNRNRSSIEACLTMNSDEGCIRYGPDEMAMQPMDEIHQYSRPDIVIVTTCLEPGRFLDWKFMQDEPL